MIKRNNKKGFTIVELVIVIAVIAILAGVLIPTFAGIIKKANLSADQQAVRQMNTALAVDGAVAPTDIFKLHEVLSEMGLTSEDYKPLTKGTFFFWDADLNRVLHVDENMTVITPAEYAGQTYVAGTSNWYSLTLEIEEEKVDGVADGGAVTITSGAQMQYVLNKLNEGSVKDIDITLNGTIDMMGAVFNLPKFDDNARYNITISNGTIKNATSVDYAQSATKTTDGHNGVYYSALIPSVGANNSVTISNIVIENMSVKNTDTSGVALLIGAVAGANAEATIENVTIKNSSVIGHRNTGALVGLVGSSGKLNLRGNITLNNVDVQTVGGSSAMLVGLKTEGAAGGQIDATGATITLDKDCSFGIYECAQNKGGELGLKDGVINSTALKNGVSSPYARSYVENALVMLSQNLPKAKTSASDFFNATINGWN